MKIDVIRIHMGDSYLLSLSPPHLLDPLDLEFHLKMSMVGPER